MQRNARMAITQKYHCRKIVFLPDAGAAGTTTVGEVGSVGIEVSGVDIDAFVGAEFDVGV